MIADPDPHMPDDPSHDPYDHFVTPAPRLRRTRRRRQRGGLARFALGIAAFVVVLAIAVTGVGFAYLRQGPLSLESLQPAIAASLQSRMSPGYRVELGPTAISRGPFGLGIGFRHLAIRDPQGRLVVNAPGGRIGLDALALLGLQVKVRRLQLEGLQLALRVAANGALSLSAGAEDAAPISLGPSPGGPAASNFGAVVASLAEAMAGVDQPLDHVGVVDARLTVLTAGRAQPAVYDSLRLTFDRSGATASASLAAHGPSGDWSVSARAEAGPQRKLTFKAEQLSVDDFLRLDPQPQRFTFDSPVSLEFAAAASPQGALTALDGSFSVGAGKFDPHDPDGAPPIAIDEATGKLSLDAQGRYALDSVEILAGATHVRFGGWLAPPLASDPLWRLHLHSQDILFAGAQPGDPAAKLDNVDLDAHFDKAASTLETDAFTLRGPQLSGELAARFHISPEGPELKLDINGAGSLMQALRLWPSFINPDARKWCEENVKGGELASGSLKIDWNAAAFAAVLAKQAPPADSVNGHFTLRAADVVLLQGLPTTSGLDAVGEITGRYFHVAAPHGVMDLGDGRKLTGDDLSFTVPDTKPVPRMAAEGGAHIAGAADALADLLTRDALKKYVVGAVPEPAGVKGQFDGDLKLDLTLGKGVQPEEQKFTVRGALTGLGIDKFIGDVKLEQGKVDVLADPTALKMTGTGVVFGAPSKLELTKAGQDIGALVLTSSLDEAARTRLGFNSGPRLKGSVTMKLKAPLDKSGASVEVDLAKATLQSLSGATWKAAGRPGKATFDLKAASDGVQVNNIVIDAGALSARGSALFKQDGAMQALKLGPLRMSPTDDLKLELDGGQPNKLTIRGASLDARDVVKGLTGGQSARDAADLDLDVKVSAALGYGKERISGLELTASRRKGAFSAIEAHGRVGKAGVSARNVGEGFIDIKSDDAGALARFLDVYDKLDGGTIDLTVNSSGETARGRATIQHFFIRDEPSLHQLEQSAPARANASRGSNAAGNSDPAPPVRFDKLTANFTRTGGNLQVRDGIVSNALFGLTVQGFIDFSADKLDLNGVYVPLYQFNHAFGGIPLLGPMLTGGENEGVFGVNYRVTGSASQPTLTVNPLSTFTPGFLRKMFGAFDGTTPSQESSPATSYAPTQPNP